MKKIIFILFFILFIAVNSYSQIEIKHNEYPKGLLSGSDLWKFTAKNTGKDNLNAVFTLALTRNDSLLYESSTYGYSISSGETITIDLNVEKPPLKNWYGNIMKGMVIREWDFLPGEYKICFTAYETNKKNQPNFDKPYGSECLNHTVINYEDDAVMEIKAKKPEKGKLYLTDLWNFTATNKSKFKQIVEVYIKLLYNGKEMLDGYSRPFSVKAGETVEKSFTWKESVVNHFMMQELRDSIFIKGFFPPGDYNLCLTVRSEWSKKEFGSNCIDQTVEAIKPEK